MYMWCHVQIDVHVRKVWGKYHRLMHGGKERERQIDRHREEERECDSEGHSHFPLNQWRSRAFSRGPGLCRAWHVFSATTCPARIIKKPTTQKRTALYSVNVLCSGSSISWGTKILLENDVIVCNGHVMLF